MPFANISHRYKAHTGNITYVLDPRTTDSRIASDCTLEDHRVHDDCLADEVPCCIGSIVKYHEVPGAPLATIVVLSGFMLIIFCLSFGLVCLAYHRILICGMNMSPVAKGISSSQIEQVFPVIRTDSQLQCVVCLLQIEGTCRRLQCGHCFHSECILNWWTHVPRFELFCPTCKQEQVIPDMYAAASRPRSQPSQAVDSAAGENESGISPTMVGFRMEDEMIEPEGHI